MRAARKKKTPTDDFIPLAVPHLGGHEWKYVKECLDTNWVSSVGPYVDRFEKDTAAFLGAKRAVACVNGTAALHIALLVAGVRPDDEVLVSTLTFIAPANAIRYVGARPVFIDAEPEYWQMDVQQVERFLVHGCRFDNNELRNKTTGRRVSAILPVHILGHTVDMDPIQELARKYNLAVIGDATECLGAKYKGRMAGRLGDIACLSFNGNKIMTTGGGGMIVTDNPVWADKARYLTTQAKDDPIEYIHHEIGYNYRLTNVLAAMGCAQLEQLPDFLRAKRRIAGAYAEAFAGLPGIQCMRQAPWCESTCWMFTMLVDRTMAGIASRALLNRLAEQRIQARPLWNPVHLNLPYMHADPMSLPVSERLYEHAISLPCSVGLTAAQQARVIGAVRSACRKA